jgi:hypothetical protein
MPYRAGNLLLNTPITIRQSDSLTVQWSFSIGSPPWAYGDTLRVAVNNSYIGSFDTSATFTVQSFRGQVNALANSSGQFPALLGTGQASQLSSAVTQATNAATSAAAIAAIVTSPVNFSSTTDVELTEAARPPHGRPRILSRMTETLPGDITIESEIES